MSRPGTSWRLQREQDLRKSPAWVELSAECLLCVPLGETIRWSIGPWWSWRCSSTVASWLFGVDCFQDDGIWIWWLDVPGSLGKFKSNFISERLVVLFICGLCLFPSNILLVFCFSLVYVFVVYYALSEQSKAKERKREVRKEKRGGTEKIKEEP